MNLILNETKYAETILKSGELGKKPSSTLFVLAKYYTQKTGLTQSETEQALHLFMQKNQPGYIPSRWSQTIQGITEKAANSPLREIDSISVTESEIACIRSLKQPRYERLLFVMLCHAKLFNLLSQKNNGWVNTPVTDIFRLARVTVRCRKDKFLILNDLAHEREDNQPPLLSFSVKNDNINSKINFITPDSKTVLSVKDFRELGYEYMNFTGDGTFIRCQHCQRLVKIKSCHDHSTRYCSTCRKERELELARKRMQKYRNRQRCNESKLSLMP